MPDIVIPDGSASRRGSEEPLDFQPSEHAIDLLKEFLSSSPALESTRSSVSTGTGSLPIGPYASPVAQQQHSSFTFSTSSSSGIAVTSAVVAVPSTTSLSLLERMHSLSAALSRALASAAPLHPPLDHEEVDRTLMAAECENAKRSIPSFRVFQEQVRGVRLMDSVRRQVDAAVRRVGGGDERVRGRRWRVEHDKKAANAFEESKEADEDDLKVRASDALLESQHIDDAILAIQSAIEEGQQGGLSARQWAMEEAAATLAHLKARRDYVKQLNAFKGAAATASPQAFVRDRLTTSCAHLNAHHLVQEGKLAQLEGTAGGGGSSGAASMCHSPALTARSPVSSPTLTPATAHSAHLLRPLQALSPAFSPVTITSETSSSSATLSTPASLSVDSAPSSRSPSQSFSQDRALLQNAKARSSSSSLSASAAPAHPSPSPSTLVRMGGFLKKKSPSSFLLASWQRRYFRLSSSALSYHPDSTANSEALGVVPLSSIKEVVEREGGTGGRFDVKVEGDRVFELEGTAEERDVWVKKIREQVDAWHERSKYSSVDSAAQASASKGKDDTARSKQQKWWKDKKTLHQQPVHQPKPQAAAPRRADGGSAKAAMSIAARVERGEFEVVKEEWGMSGGVGRLLVVRDRSVPIPAAFLPRSPSSTPPSASPPTYPPSSRPSSPSLPPLPSSAIVHRHDGLYMLHLLPRSTPANVLSAVTSSFSGLSHPALLRPLVQGATLDQHFTLYSPYTAPAAALSSHLSRVHRFPLSSISHLALHITLALGYLHSESRGCGRLSVDTCNLDDKGGLVLSHMGLSMTMEERVKLGGDEEEVEGRVECMSPEQLRVYQRLKGETKDAKEAVEDEGDFTVVRMIDWWRLGVLLYELATGALPFFLKLRGYTTSTSSLPSGSSTAQARALARSRLLQVLKQNANNPSFLLFPSSTAKSLQSLIVQLLTFDTEQRLGALNDWRDVLAHPFFECTDSEQLDLLDHPQPAPPPSIQQIIDASTPAHAHPRSEAAASAAPYYSYHYSLAITILHASQITSVTLPSSSTALSTNSSVPALYVHAVVDDTIRVTSTITGSTSPAWNQAFEFPLPLKKKREEEGEGEQGERVEDGDTEEWQELRVRLEVRHQIKDGAHAKQGEVLHQCVGQAECTVGQLLQMHGHALASACASLSRPASASFSQSANASSSDLVQCSSFALSLLSLDGVPNGELHVEVGVREEKRVATDAAEEERWEGRVKAKELFAGLDDWNERDGRQPPRGWEGRDRTGGKQHAGSEDERFVEQPTPIVKQTKDAQAKAEKDHKHEDGHDTQRYRPAGLDLDLSYITHRILVSAIPRPDAHDPAHTQALLNKFLSQTHANHHRIIKLLQRGADTGQVAANERILYLEGDVIALWQLMDLCAEVDEWLSADGQHVLLVECDDGAHLSGWLVCAFLLFDHFCADIDTAVKLVSSKRCTSAAPSPISFRQLTQLTHLHQLIHGDCAPARASSRLLSPPLRILHVRVSHVIADVYVRIRTVGAVAYDLWDSRHDAKHECDGAAVGWTVDVGGRICSGDVCLGLWKKASLMGQDECVLEVYWHTSWIKKHYACWKGNEVEGRWKRKSKQHVEYPAQCEVFFAPV